MISALQDKPTNRKEGGEISENKQKRERTRRRKRLSTLQSIQEANKASHYEEHLYTIIDEQVLIDRIVLILPHLVQRHLHFTFKRHHNV